MGIELGREPEDFLEVQFFGNVRPAKCFHQCGVILDFETLDAKGITALFRRFGQVACGAENEFVLRFNRV